jgi:protein gp37
MNKSKIEWCDSTWNPVTGCLHGCEYCYARKIAERFKPFDLPHLTDKGVYESINELNTPIATVCKDGKDRICAYPYGFEPTMHSYRLNVPSLWTKPRTIFVCSMADLFGEWVPDEWIESVFRACEKAPQHRYLFLTKNPGRYCDLYRKGILPDRNNYWFGATFDHSNWNRKYIDGRPPTFMLKGKMIHDAGDYYFPDYPENRRFVSFEPLLYDIGEKIGSTGANWHIIGAETGNRKGKAETKLEWVEHILEYSDRNNIPVFMKDSLIPIVGEENMRREFPWNK